MREWCDWELWRAHIGEGSYGTVKEALNIETHERVALKVCKEHALRRIPGGIGFVEEEIRIMQTLQHPHIIEMRSHWKEQNKL